MVTPSQSLLAARRAVDGMPDVTLLETEWRWYPEISKWALPCRLTLPLKTQPSEFIFRQTDWYVLVDNNYPLGTVKFYPAKFGGITATFPHQNYNGLGNSDFPWRTGSLCLDTIYHAMHNRVSGDNEPDLDTKRLVWHFKRALNWLEAAATQTLVQPGEPFELPHFPTTADKVLAFNESLSSYKIWAATSSKIGRVELFNLPTKPTIAVVKKFQDLAGRLIYVPSWGYSLSSGIVPVQRGLWLLLDFIPVIAPWQIPTTWGQLRELCQKQGINLDSLLEPGLQWLRNGCCNILLVGFKIPAKEGEEPVQLHWQGVELPILSSGNQVVNGFRPGKKGWSLRDRHFILKNDTTLRWLRSENWEQEQITSRGRLPRNLRDKKILLIGAGAIGSIMADQLVRAGAVDMVIVDGDPLQVGNLARHRLLVMDIGQSKAQRLAQRLNLSAPHARIIGINANFPEITNSDLVHVLDCDIIIDCTATDLVLQHLNSFDWRKEKLFCSVSVGQHSHRLFFFQAYGLSFPEEIFQERVRPWLTLENELISPDEELPREALGCWHPLFPARLDDVELMTGVAIKVLEKTIIQPPAESQLEVFEQYYSSDGNFEGIRRARLD